MQARDWQHKRTQPRALVMHYELRLPASRMLQDLQPKNSFRIHAIGEYATARAREQCSQKRIVQTGRSRSIERHAIHKIEKGPLHILHIAIAIHVLAVQIGHDRENGRQLQKRAIAFVRLGDQIFGAAQSRARSHRLHPATYNYGRVKSTGGQHGRNHGGGGGFAMHPRDSDAIFQAHQLRQHLRSLNDRNRLPMGGQNFWILWAQSGCSHDYVRPGDVGGCVTLKNDGPQTRQTVGNGGTLQVGAGDAMTQVEKNFGNSAHTDATNTNEMYVLRADEHLEWEPDSYCSSDGSVENAE